MSPTRQTRQAPFSRKRKWIAGISALVIASLWWGGNHLIAAQFKKALTSSANKKGMSLEWKTSSWDPWRGLHLTDVRLNLQDEEKAPLVELGNLNISLPLHQIFTNGRRQTTWSVSHSDVILRDTAGIVKLKNISLDLKASNSEIQVVNFKSGDKGLTTNLKGKIIFSPLRRPSSEPIKLNLAPVRATLATLDVSPEEGAFHVTGNFIIDLRNGEHHWLADLNGTGRDLKWKGVRWKSASAQANLTSTASEIRYHLDTANGSTHGIITKSGWRNSPFTFKGELTDSLGRKDEYIGNHHKQVLTVESLLGDADLHRLSQDIPGLATQHPKQVEFRKFPMVDLRSLIFDSSNKDPRLSFTSLELTANEGITITTDGRKTELLGLEIKTAYDGNDLTISESRASVFNGNVTMSGSYRDGVLRRSEINVKGIKLTEIKHLIGAKSQKSGPGVLSMEYKGNVDFKRKRADGYGSMRLANAPVLEVPLLDQVYDIFMELIPGVERASEGTFDATFKVKGDIVDVTKFEAKGGPLTVSAVGKMDLDTRRVSGRARGKLVGLPGLITKPLSRLLEMDVAGPYGDIRVKPLGPAKLASNTASGTVGVVVDTIEETGKVAGTVLSEGVKLPFRMFQKDKEEDKKAD